MLKFVTILAIISVVFAAESNENCLKKFNVTPDIYTELQKDIENTSEHHLCFVKCSYEEAGALDAEGNINYEKMNLGIDRFVKLNEKDKQEANECMKKLKPVKTCQDIKPLRVCIYKSKVQH